jgi:hypothetical protein
MFGLAALMSMPCVFSAYTPPDAIAQVYFNVVTQNPEITSISLQGVDEIWYTENNPFMMQGYRSLAAAASDNEKLVGSFETQLYDTQGHQLSWSTPVNFLVYQKPGDHTHWQFLQQLTTTTPWTMEAGSNTVTWHVIANWQRYIWQNNQWVFDSFGHLEDMLTSDMVVSLEES